MIRIINAWTWQILIVGWLFEWRKSDLIFVEQVLHLVEQQVLLKEELALKKYYRVGLKWEKLWSLLIQIDVHWDIHMIRKLVELAFELWCKYVCPFLTIILVFFFPVFQWLSVSDVLHFCSTIDLYLVVVWVGPHHIVMRRRPVVRCLAHVLQFIIRIVWMWWLLTLW